MKKRTLLALAVAMSVTAVAAANPFSDVPARHWAYDSVEKLSKAGIVDGYEDGTFRGERTMTRYEMAQIIARALAKVPTSTGGGDNGALKAELDKLSVEFAKELKNLGVRVTALENQKGANVKFSGDMRIRYRGSEDGHWTSSTAGDASHKGKNLQDTRTRLQFEGKVNENWSVVGRFSATNDLRTSAGLTTTMDKAFVKAQYGDFGIRVGRIDVMPAYGIMFDDYADMGEVTWNSDKFFAAARYGRLSGTTYSYVASGAAYDPTTYMIELGALNIAKGLNVRAQYTRMDDGTASGGIWEAGADYTFGESGFKLTAAAADTTGDLSVKGDSDTAWFAQVDYKGAKKAEKGSWGAFLGYRDFQDSGAPQITTFNTTGKGWYVGGSYTPATNIVLKAWYENMKPHDGSLTGKAGSSKDYIRAQAEFFF